MLQIFKFEPLLKTVIWGGEKIAARKRLSGAGHSVGESWEISGVTGHESVVSEGEDKGLLLGQLIEKYKGDLVGDAVYKRFGNRFPLLVKLIDAGSNLSVQVHPDDDLAMRRHGCQGKTEMWYILETDPNAKIYVGFSRKLTPDEYERMVADNSIMDAVMAYDSKPGDIFYLPPGRIHTIGAGNLLAEIQQTSDITYRIYDYDRRDTEGRPRQLHTAEAREAIDFTVHPSYITAYDRGANPVELVDCDRFRVSRLTVEGSRTLESESGSFIIAMCIEGLVTIKAEGMNEVKLELYETALIPAAARGVEVAGSARLLLATV